MRRGIAPRETHQRKINNKHIKLFNDMVTRLTKGRLKVTISETRAELGEVAAARWAHTSVRCWKRSPK